MKIGIVSLWLATELYCLCASTNPPAPAGGLPASPSARARVVLVQDPQALDAFRPRPEVIAAMLDRAIIQFTHKPDVASAWGSLIATQDVVGIKVFSLPGPIAGTRPAVVEAVVRGLKASGHPANKIIIWDKHFDDLKSAGFVLLAMQLGVRAAGAAEAGYDDAVFYEKPLVGNLVFGDHEFGIKAEGVGRKSFVSKLVTRETTRLINITPVINHNLAGVTGHLYSLSVGSVDNTLRFESNLRTLNEVVPEIYNLPSLADRVALNITDALICQYQGGEEVLLHYSTALNELRLSRDPVALDALSLDEITRERSRSKMPGHALNSELLGNASLLELGVSDLKAITIEPVKLP